MSGLPSALAFLTRIPVGGSGRKPWDPAGALPWFPVVGALVGAAVVAVYALGSVVFPAEVAAAIAVAAGMALTGGLHEDGLADTFDALGATSRADALRILSDPAHGTYGLLALVVGTTVRVFALGSLRPVTALGVLVAAHALARAAAVSVLLAMPAAKDHGLAVSHASGVSRRPAIATASVGIALAGVGMGPWALPAVALVAAGAALVGFAALRRFGGITGDVLGAVEQVGEVAVVVMGSGAARVGGLWW